MDFLFPRLSAPVGLTLVPHCIPTGLKGLNVGDVALCYCCNKTSVLYTTACQPCLRASMRASKKCCDARMKKSFVCVYIWISCEDKERQSLTAPTHNPVPFTGISMGFQHAL